MHVVFDARIHLDHITGISRYILFLLSNLLKSDTVNSYTVLINNTLPDDDIIYKTLRSFSNVDIKRIDLPHFGPVNYTKMPSIIRKLKPTVYHYPHLDAPISGIPTISTIHDANFRSGIKKYNDAYGLKTFYFKYSLKNTLKKSDQIIFISNSVKQEVLGYYKIKPQPKHNVIYNGFEEFSAINPQIIIDTKQKYKLPENYFLFVGQLREHKNIHRIIEAFNLLNQHNWHLVLVGYRYPNYHVNTNYKNVHYLGIVSDQELTCIYSLSKAFLFPSLIEGFGLPILEAMSMSVPVITSDFGATKEISGDAALLVDPFDTADLKDKMSLISGGNISADLKEKGLLRVKEFNWQKCAEQVHMLYTKLS